MASMKEHNDRVMDSLIPQFEISHGREVALGEAARWTLLHHVDRLVGAGVAVDCRIGDLLVTPLMLAGKKAAAKRLLELGADPNATDANGHTAIMWMFISHYRKTETFARVKLLLTHGADKAIMDQSGRTAFDYATDRGDVRCMELLSS
ncbi:MAG: ankyrin repeat domain-containing protein [Planctomycetaceae bacterium]|nr:ankyrin repeat domain-containing protein [Planctomycetaceae bacterium]